MVKRKFPIDFAGDLEERPADLEQLDHDVWDYRWPEDAMALTRRMERDLDGIKQALKDLSTLCRAHYASAPSDRLMEAYHEAGHVLGHVEEVHRTLRALYETPSFPPTEGRAATSD